MRLPGTYISPAESGLYYLQSRYYNPELGRFINADALASTGQGLLGNNMFAYCGNNPVINADDSGFFFGTVVGGLVGGLFGALSAVVDGKTGAEIAASVLGGMASGVVSGLAADVLLLTGGTAGVVVGTIAAAGAVGAVASNAVESGVLGQEMDLAETAADVVWGAATGALFGYMGGEIASNIGKISSKGFMKVAGNVLLKENVLETAVEDVLTNMCDFVAGFTLDIMGKRFSDMIN